ncbi:hypothetical protein GF339_13480 [candidate division KSB3 bacterium]|uniref:Uncharacterized protein n=1 Tax=candidate division KSB3 bacterium TaxID=2044937 RepID=A0A9D5Q6C8_9BACT|nr:hypothetical protein [candidate division KSB3 bacterium]MBD3325590.1 hypothetical protein [candidate division KSB3 bacterium]
MPISSSSMPRTAKLYTAQQAIEQLESRSRSLRPELRPEEAAEQEKALHHAKKEKKQFQARLNLSLLLGILVVVTVVLAIARALPQKTGVFWLFQVPPIPHEFGDFATVLAPFLAISIAIERLLETAFNWFEQSSRAVADILVAPRETLDWVGKEYQEAYEATKQAAETVEVETTPETLELLEMAETRLAKAEERLRGWVNAPEYLAWKRALCIWFGLLSGLVIAVLGDLKMLSYIGIPAPRFIDMLVTGLIIGSGPGPMHDLIGILQGGKNALNNLGQLAKGKSVQHAVDALRQAEADARHRREEG